jgi:hypothetical protein
MKSETPAQRYRREADECQLNAQRAIRVADREAWLKLAVDWRKLAESAELNPMLDTRRHWFEIIRAHIAGLAGWFAR